MKVYNIPAHQKFFQTLYEGIIERFENKKLHELVIYLPNKNSCYELAHNFYENLSKNNGILLPKIISLGEISEITDTNFESEFNDFHDSLPIPINFEEQKLLIIDIINKQFQRKKFSTNEIVNLADKIARIILKFRIDDVPLSNLKTITSSNQSTHLALYFELLKIISEDWEKILKSQNKIDFLEYRNLYIKKILSTNKNHSKTIIAGTTGSIKSTRNFINYILENNGSLIINGLDINLTETEWGVIEDTHPNFGIKKLLEYIKIKSENILPWSKNQVNSCNNFEILSDVFLPTSHIDKWFNKTKKHLDDYYIDLIETQDLNQETLAITCKVKEIIESNSNAKIGIFVHNNNYFQRIQNHLKLWGINAINSHGISIGNTEHYHYLSLVNQLINEKFVISNLLAILKHSFTYMNYSKEELNFLIETLEKKYLRKICNFSNLNDLILVTEEKDIKTLLINFEDNIAALKISTSNFTNYVKNIVEIVSYLTTYNNFSIFWNCNYGAQLREILDEQLYVSSNRNFPNQNYFTILSSILELKKIYNNHQDNRITIMSTIDGRLIDFTHVILTEFNDDVWFTKEVNDPWLSELTYKQLGIEHEIIKKSLRSYDFYCLAQKPNIILTRPKNKDGSPTNKSRWLERIELFCLVTGQNIINRTDDLIKNCKQLFLPYERFTYQVIDPCPNKEMRPREFSATQIESLMRDPYAVYAKKILNLKELPLIDKDPDHMEFGNIVHEIIDEFNNSYDFIDVQNMYDKFIQIISKKLKRFSRKIFIQKLWFPRLMEIAKFYCAFEKIRRLPNTKILSEKEGYIIFSSNAGSFKLKAKADQIQISNNQVTIIDFKTGLIPSIIDIEDGYSPQMPLEALILNKEGFIPNITQVENLQYIQFSSGKSYGTITNLKNIQQLIETAEKGVLSLINFYTENNTPYLICPYVDKMPKYNEYKYLERIEEWLT